VGALWRQVFSAGWVGHAAGWAWEKHAKIACRDFGRITAGDGNVALIGHGLARFSDAS
jgi:hypothetical protein